MDRLQKLLTSLQSIPGIKKVYYQPPASLAMEYDCIRVTKERIHTMRANNVGYRLTDRYNLIYITRNSNSQVPSQLLRTFPMCEFERSYVSNNLYHHVFALYY